MSLPQLKTKKQKTTCSCWKSEADARMKESALGRSGGRLFHQKERENICLQWNNILNNDRGKRGNDVRTEK